MGALAVRPAARPRPVRDRSTQPRLFVLPGGAQAQPLVSRPVPLRAIKQAAGPVTLDCALLAGYAGLAAGHPIACPVCDGMMVPRPSAAEGHAGGRCVDCGTMLD